MADLHSSLMQCYSGQILIHSPGSTNFVAITEIIVPNLVYLSTGALNGLVRYRLSSGFMKLWIKMTEQFYC